MAIAENPARATTNFLGICPIEEHWGLIGHTGFVGSNLSRDFIYDEFYNSENINKIRGRTFDALVCAAIPAAKWQANRDPDGDWKNIQVLLTALETVKVDRFILISTVDVYPNPVEVTEDFDPTPLPNHAYGTHRLRVERWVAQRFANHHILRLPGLFGPGLKKNVLFDLLNNRELEAIQPESRFQYYDLAHLSMDLYQMLWNGIRLMNLATEPISTGTILERFFPQRQVGQRASAPVSYDFRSIHAGLWKGSHGYLYSAETVLDDLGRFLSRQPGYRTPGASS
jgi:dTDP-4-dehydrorhamnose reductase